MPKQAPAGEACRGCELHNAQSDRALAKREERAAVVLFLLEEYGEELALRIERGEHLKGGG